MHEDDHDVLFQRSRVAITDAGRLAAGFAHDLGNELAVLKLHAELLLRHPDMTGAMRDHVTGICDQVERASELVVQAVGMARGAEARLVPTDVSDALDRLVPVLRRLVPPSITIDADLPATTLRLSVDAGRIRQIVIDLVRNAADAMPDGGVVTMRCTEEHAPQRGMRLTIIDRGVGMADDVSARAFEPFFSTKAPTEAAGLGLTTVARFVADHNGRVEVDSSPGRGTSVDVWIPG